MRTSHQVVQTPRTLFVAAMAALILLLCACSQDVKRESNEPHVYYLRENFDGATFPTATWTAYGLGVLTQDAAQGTPQPSLRIAPGGVLSGLRSGNVQAQGVHFAVHIAIDPTPGSGAMARFALRVPGSGTLVASVTVTEGQITYVMGAASPVVLTWSTDSAFHEFEFQGIAITGGGHWWKRNGQLAASSTAQMTATGLYIELESSGTANVWFDDARAFVMAVGPA